MENLYFLALAFVAVLYGLLLKRSKIPKHQLPPVVDIATEDIFTRPREAYRTALQTHGAVIAVKRKGNLEYIVGPEYARHVLTCDRLFSFEEGSAAVSITLTRVLCYSYARHHRL